MDDQLKEQLVRFMFRFKKIGIMVHSGAEVHMGEVFLMIRVEENACVSDIQRDLYITKPAVSQMLNSLEKKGFVHRENDPSDRRKIAITLTPKGQEFVNQMKEYASEMLGEIVSRFGAGNTKQLIALFNRFADITEELRRETKG